MSWKYSTSQHPNYEQAMPESVVVWEKTGLIHTWIARESSARSLNGPLSVFRLLRINPPTLLRFLISKINTELNFAAPNFFGNVWFAIWPRKEFLDDIIGKTEDTRETAADESNWYLTNEEDYRPSGVPYLLSWASNIIKQTRSCTGHIVNKARFVMSD